MNIEKTLKNRGKCMETTLRKTWVHILRQNYKEKQQTWRRISEIAHDVMPADCGLDFERISSPQSPAITTRKVPDSLRCHWRKSTEIVWESAQGMTNIWKRESANDTHQPTAKWQDLNQECPLTRSTFLESQHISAKYIRYFKLLKGVSVTITKLSAV